MPLASAARHLAGIVLLALLPSAHAACLGAQAAADAITRATQSVVGLQVTVAEDARFGDTLARSAKARAWSSARTASS